MFANYKHHGKYLNNLGDQVQIMIVDYLYNLMGGGGDEIVYIDTRDLSTYDGPPVKLPVNMPLVNYREKGYANLFSKKITPIFFGFSMPKKNLHPEEVAYLKRYEPIGCRDEQTYNVMTQYGIDAYLGGCLTITFPRREIKDTQNKVFIVDVPEKLKKIIPDEFLSNSMQMSHTLGYLENPLEVAKDRYTKYIDEASLVITSLLHASVPCFAFGIPVIFAVNALSYRFAWLEKLFPIHMPPDFEHIQYSYNLACIDSDKLENHKKIVRELFRKRMLGEDATNEIKYVHNFYIHRERKGIYVGDGMPFFENFLASNWKDFEKEYHYSIWGLTQWAEVLVDYISEHYPNAKLEHVYDIREGIVFRGIASIAPTNLENYPNETVFVTAPGACESARKLFNKLKRSDTSYAIVKLNL